MKKCLVLSMLIIGTIVGAGFASGREVVAFFGKNVSLWTVPIVGICFFLFCTLFLTVGNRIKKSNISEVNAVFLGKLHFVADIFLLLNSLVILAGMLSAMDALLGLVFPAAPFYSILSGIICAVVVSRGLRAILKCNVIIVPLAIIILILVCLLNISDICNPAPFSSFSIYASIIYVSMNIMLACTFFITLHDLKKSTILIGSAISAIILSILMLLLILAIRSGNVYDYKMPLLELAGRVNKPLFYFGVIIIAMSIFTTMLTSMNTLKIWVQGFGCGDIFSITVVLMAGLIVSNLGFENVVGYLYPIIGIVGILYIAITIFYLLNQKYKSNKLKTS